MTKETKLTYLLLHKEIPLIQKDFLNYMSSLKTAQEIDVLLYA